MQTNARSRTYPRSGGGIGKERDMAGIDFDELERRITSYDKRDIRESLEVGLSGVTGDNRIDAYAIILCENGDPPTHQIVSAGNGNLLANKLVVLLEANPELYMLFREGLTKRFMERLNDKYNKK